MNPQLSEAEALLKEAAAISATMDQELADALRAIHDEITKAEAELEAMEEDIEKAAAGANEEIDDAVAELLEGAE